MKRVLIVLLVSVLALLLSACDGISENKPENEDLTGFYPIGEEISIDLNGDDVMEKIYFGMDDFKINDISYNEIILYVYENNPMTDNFIISDIDTKDKQYEIGLMVEGPSSDPEVYFYTYDGKNLVELGSIPSYIEDVSLAFDGDGIINGTIRLSVLQTWFAPAKWELLNSGISLRDQELYFPIHFESELPVILKMPLPIYENLGDADSNTVLNPQEVTFIATDDNSWCQIEGNDGVKGWFRIEGFYHIPDLNVDAVEVFDNLCFAD